MVKKFCVIAIVGIAFFACNKDKEFTTTQGGKLLGSTGIWECTVSSPIGTITVPDGQTPPCMRYFVNRFWNAAEQRYMGFSHTTEVHKCGTGAAAEVLTSVEFVAQINPDIPKADLDYSNVNHFILTVDGIEVAPGFVYEKDFVYTIIGADGDAFTVVGTILVTYENVLNVWHEINEKIWVGEPQRYYSLRLCYTSDGKNGTSCQLVSSKQDFPCSNPGPCKPLSDPGDQPKIVLEQMEQIMADYGGLIFYKEFIEEFRLTFDYLYEIRRLMHSSDVLYEMAPTRDEYYGNVLPQITPND